MDQKRDINDRVTTLEADAKLVGKQQDERHVELLAQNKEMSARMTRIEDRHVMLLTTALFTLAGVVSTLLILLLKK